MTNTKPLTVWWGASSWVLTVLVRVGLMAQSPLQRVSPLVKEAVQEAADHEHRRPIQQMEIIVNLGLQALGREPLKGHPRYNITVAPAEETPKLEPITRIASYQELEDMRAGGWDVFQADSDWMVGRQGEDVYELPEVPEAQRWLRDYRSNTDKLDHHRS